MPTFRTYRARYEYLKNGPRVEAIRKCFAESQTILPVDAYDAILDLLLDAVLAEDDIALVLIQDKLRERFIEFRRQNALRDKELLRIREERFDPLVEAIQNELKRLTPLPVLVRLEEDPMLRHCVREIKLHPDILTVQICRALNIPVPAWQRCGNALSMLELAKSRQGKWTLTELGERALQEFVSQRLLAQDPLKPAS